MHFRLLLLPPELILACLSQLMPNPLPTGSAGLDVEYLIRRSALKSLCLTSKNCYRFTQALLYRNVTVRDHYEAIKLFMTLLIDSALFKNKICMSIRHFACLAELDSWNGVQMCFDSVWSKINPRLATWPQSAQNELRRVHNEIRGKSLGDDQFKRQMLSRIVAHILVSASRVEDVLLQVPGAECEERYVELMRALGVHPTSARPNLRAVRLQGDPAVGSVMNDEVLSDVISTLDPMAGINPTFLDPFFSLYATHIELFGDYGDWIWLFGHADTEEPNSGWSLFEDEEEEIEEALIRLSDIEDLRLLASRSSPAWVHRLLKYSPDLKKFTWTFRPDEWTHWTDFEHHGRFREMSVDEALLAGADKLESLHVENLTRDSASNQNFTTFIEVHCLAEFIHLRHLTIDLTALIGGYQHACPRLYPKVSYKDRLPQSLKSLVLIEKYYQDELRRKDFFDGRYQELEDCVAKLFNDVEEDLPHLTQIAFKLYPFPELHRPGLIRNNNSLELLKKRLTKRGIEFDWEWHDGFFECFKWRHVTYRNVWAHYFVNG